MQGTSRSGYPVQVTHLRVIQAGEFSDWLRETKWTEHTGAQASVACGECVGCCTSSHFVHVDSDEYDTVAAIPAELLFPAPGLPAGTLLMGIDEKGHCPMLKEGHCLIYALRPRTCRDYDCRVLRAANLSAGGREREAINRRLRQWEFQFSSEEGRQAQQAIADAAHFLSSNRQLFPVDSLPTNPSQLARVAINVYEEFLDRAERDPADIVRGVMARLQSRRGST